MLDIVALHRVVAAEVVFEWGRIGSSLFSRHSSSHAPLCSHLASTPQVERLTRRWYWPEAPWQALETAAEGRTVQLWGAEAAEAAGADGGGGAPAAAIFELVSHLDWSSV